MMTSNKEKVTAVQWEVEEIKDNSYATHLRRHKCHR